MLEDAAALLYDARRDRQAVPPVSTSHGVNDLEDAYKVQQINTLRWLKEGRRQIGRKIGLTSTSVQQQLGVDQPDFGVLFDDMRFGDGDEIPVDRLLQPRIEAEIAYVLGGDLIQEESSLEMISEAIDHAVVAAEIVDSAIADWKITLADTVADNASCGLFVLGSEKHRLSDFDQRTCGMILSRNGTDVSFGVGAACLGHPLNAVKWLADKSVALGEPLKAGEVILSGALGPMVDAAPGDRFTIEVAGLGLLTVPFSGL